MDDEFSQAMSLCQSAVRAPELWPVALHALASAIAASRPIDPPGRVDGESSDLPESYEALAEPFAEGWRAGMSRAAVHPWASGMERPRSGAAEWSPGAGGRTIAAGEFSRPSGAEVPVPATVRDGTQSDAEGATVARTAIDPPADGVRGALGALDYLFVPALMLDGRGLIRDANRHVDVSAGSGLRINRQALIAEDAASHVDLQRLIHDVFDRGGPAAAEPAVIRRPMRRPLVVDAVRVSSLLERSPGREGALLVIRDLERRTLLTEAQVRRVFELTRSELRLVMLVAEGEDLGACGERLGWSRETTRSVLKTVFSKTETHRQAELVALLARLRH